jgi:ATP-binding cassette subfamily B (MDR/TAP) protein 1
MESETNSIRANGTWDLVELPRNRKAVSCKWVFRLKQVSDSSDPKYKARIVAKGFRQEYGVDFDKILSPVVKLSTLRFLLGVVVHEDLELLQLDVKTTFLHGDLDEEIYMEQPQGFASPGREHLVCRLRKSLYGLK